MLRLQRLLSVSHNLLYKVAKHPQSVLKFTRILSNSGCLVAGCCFSRQSDEEARLVTGTKHNYKDISETDKNRTMPQSSDSNFDQRGTNSKNMKRSYESINDNILLNADAGENADLVCDVYSKKKKTDDTETTEEGHIKVKLSAADSLRVTEPPNKPLEKSKVEIETPKRCRPNYFVAIKISDAQIHQELNELQLHILKRDDRLKRSMIELKTLHITLMVMHIGDPETHARAMKALENIHHEHNEDMSRNPLKLEFKGLGHFQNRVLYAKLITDDSYQRLCVLAESVKKHFESVLIFTTDSRKDFNPHLTVAKIDFKKKQNKFIKKINPSLYKDFNNQYFGSQKVESIQLLSMMDPKNEAGYYSGNEIYFSAFDPNVKLNSLNKMLETEEKKKNIKEMISALTKEKLK